MLTAALKRGDNVVLNSGLIGKVVRVEDKEVGLEVAQGVTVQGRQGDDRRSARQGRTRHRQRHQVLITAPRPVLS